MDAIKNTNTEPVRIDFDETLKDILIEDLNVFKLTRGQFLCNNQRKYRNDHLVA